MQPNDPRDVLFIAYEFPPSAGGGVQRVSKIARYLPDSGWAPHVLAAHPVKGRPLDYELAKALSDVPVTRSSALHVASTVSTVFRPFKRLRHRSGAAGATSGPGARAGRSPMSTRVSRWLASPDDAVFWGRKIPSIAERLCRKKSFSVILASGPPFSALVAAVRAGERLDLPVVVDMRDPWVGNMHARWPTTWHKRRFHDLEVEVVSKATAVIAVSDVIAEEARGLGARRVEVIPNGFDPVDMPKWDPDSQSPVRIVFLGRLSPTTADPSAFFAGLALARERTSSLADVCIDIVGPDAPWAAAAAERAGVGAQVVFHGFKPYSQALEMVSRADVGLILFADTPGSEGVYSGKLFDYLGIGIPVLLYGPPHGAAADVVREARCGYVVPYGDVEAMAITLTEVAEAKQRGERLCDPIAGVRDRFDRRLQVRKFGRILDEVAGEKDVV